VERALVSLRLAAAVGVLLWGACSYGPSFGDCTIQCAGQSDCPTGFSCGDESLCRPSGAAASCAMTDALGDAQITTRCTGEPRACRTFNGAAKCVAHAGCSFGKTCQLADLCQYPTRAQCEAAPGCQANLTTSTCEPIPGYCSGTTKNECEAKASCQFVNSCHGTAAPCNTRVTEEACTQHIGCAWQ
jgi:hypothetical protein